MEFGPSWNCYSRRAHEHLETMVVFFEGDALRVGDDVGSVSLIGICVIRLPRLVCIVVTSNMSGFGLESLSFPIDG